jgi:hypothetical protein
MEVLMIKSLRVRVAAVGLLAALFGGSAQATAQFYNWSLDFTVGPLTGDYVRGTISVDGNDCPKGTCVGNFRAEPPATPLQLLSLNITVDGVPFTLANDTGFGSGFPDVTFGPLGNLVNVDYQGQVTFGGLTYTLDTSGSGGTGTTVGNFGPEFYQGPVGFPTLGPQGISIAVLGAPEPATIPLLGAALIVAVLIARRGRAPGSPAGLRS